MTDLVFGKAPKPDIIDMVCPKPYDGAGFTRLAYARGPYLIGPCQHETAGGGTIEFYHDFFSTGGERQYDALVDYVIGRDGRIGMLNDPTGTREPWASGGSDGLEGKGVPFYQRFGPKQNVRLWSKEHIALDGQAWTDAQFAASVALDVWHLDQLKVPFATYPINPAVNLDVNYSHFHFATKPCAGPWYVANEARYQAAVKAGLQAAQEVTGSTTPDPPVVVPDLDPYPAGMDEAKAKKRFGRLRHHPLEGPVTYSGFRLPGKISVLWLLRGDDTGLFPQAQDHYFIADNDAGPNRDRVTVEIVTFENGWILGRPADRAEWTWFN
jgi:hypothetical protein